MIEKRHDDERSASIATFSDCMAYRYLLTRVWSETGDRALFVMLNPSTADEIKNDPTVERCERRARALGFGAFRVVNIFAFRATDPKVMRAHPSPIGPANDAAILESCDWASRVICAWGTHGAHLGRGSDVEALIRARGAEPWHLGLTKQGHPKHPLYISYSRSPERWLA